ncbi:MAG: UDP-glycosyltransferase [Nonlabens sp.]|uniref:UDP-glycosyltransferase n=1 Tax=Nonlabens sp. TaxID=1888209 RepID=UPI003EF38E72
MNKKVFILLPDGVGLRNFALTQFKEVGEQHGFNITYWNNTNFSIESELGYPELKINSTRIHPKTPVISHARKRVELAISHKRTQDEVYSTYRFPLKWNSLKNIAKSAFVKFHETYSASPKGWQRLMDQMNAAERSTQRYQEVKAQLEEHQPDLIFCTTQRATQAIAPLLAAQDLGIKTACWIYSWDNLPKGMTTVETHFYFVWSELMKAQLLEYYPKTRENQIFVTGTPQFEPHYDGSLLHSRKRFCEQYGLKEQTKYICFSGDDVTTSPLDHLYLRDLAQAVDRLNAGSSDYGIIFRRVPTDLSARYDDVLKEFKHLIIPIEPLWISKGNNWNQVQPTREDMAIFSNVCEHSIMVCNIGSSTIFDFIIHNKLCLYFNYEQELVLAGKVKGIKQCYDYVHFKSMPQNAVCWINSVQEIENKILATIKDVNHQSEITKKWYRIINKPESPENASERIWNGLKKILS